MARSNFILLLLVSGNSAKLLQAHGFSSNEVDVIKIDEKMFASPKSVLNLIRTKPYRAVYFGCDALSAHRFLFFSKLWIALTTRRGGVIDEHGEVSMFNSLRFLFVEIPHFIVEVLVSLIVVICFHIQIMFDRRAFRNARR